MSSRSGEASRELLYSVYFYFTLLSKQASNLFNERSVLRVNQWQSVEMSALAEQTVQVRVMQHGQRAVVRHGEMERVDSCHTQTDTTGLWVTIFLNR